MNPHKISTHLAFSDNCYFHLFLLVVWTLIELKFCEVSRNSISNWTWKFQLSILRNKKVLFLKKIFMPLSILKQKSFVYCLNFPEGFEYSHQSCSSSVILDFYTAVHSSCHTLWFWRKKVLYTWFQQSNNFFILLPRYIKFHNVS